MPFRFRRLGLFVVLAAIAGCGTARPVVTGTGVESSETRELPAFTSVELYGVGSTTVTSGAKRQLTIRADDNMLTWVKSSVADGTLRIGVGDGDYVWHTGFPRIALSGSAATSYELSGQTTLVIEDVDADSLTIKANGQCAVTIRGRVKSLHIELQGQSQCDLTGATVTSLQGSLNGQCDLSYSGEVQADVKANPDSTVRQVEAPPASESSGAGEAGASN